MNESKSPRGWLRIVVIQVLVFAILAAGVEFGLRLVKSFTRDGGAITLLRASINSRGGSPRGWQAPSDEEVVYSRPCYGDIRARYNEHGQRLDYTPAPTKPAGTKRVCVVGDSTSQAYQLSDGQPYYHQLQTKLENGPTKVEILPMAVGGFGPLQHAMLLKEFCFPYDPDLIIWQLDANDLTNSSYELERYGGRDNNFRRRPYWEDGGIVYRRPMVLPDLVDSVVLRLLNALLVRSTADRERAKKALPSASKALASMLRDYLGPLPAPGYFFFSSTPDDDAYRYSMSQLKVAFSEHGLSPIEVAGPAPELTCASAGDSHRNADGHRAIADRLEPVIRAALWP